MNYGPETIYQINEMPSLILTKDKYKITTQQILKHISREKKRFLLYTFPPNVSLTKKETFVTDVMRCCFYFSNLKPYSGSNTRDNRELKSTFHDFLHFQRYFVTLFLGRFRNGSGWEHMWGTIRTCTFTILRISYIFQGFISDETVNGLILNFTFFWMFFFKN